MNKKTYNYLCTRLTVIQGLSRGCLLFFWQWQGILAGNYLRLLGRVCRSDCWFCRLRVGKTRLRNIIDFRFLGCFLLFLIAWMVILIRNETWHAWPNELCVCFQRTLLWFCNLGPKNKAHLADWRNINTPNLLFCLGQTAIGGHINSVQIARVDNFLGWRLNFAVSVARVPRHRGWKEFAVLIENYAWFWRLGAKAGGSWGGWLWRHSR